MFTNNSERGSILSNSVYTDLKVTFKTKGALAVAPLIFLEKQNLEDELILQLDSMYATRVLLH